MLLFFIITITFISISYSQQTNVVYREVSRISEPFASIDFRSVISNDGNTLISCSYNQRCRAFLRTDHGKWANETELPYVSDGLTFGTSLAISGDGLTFVLGSLSHEGFYVFRRDSNLTLDFTLIEQQTSFANVSPFESVDPEEGDSAELFNLISDKTKVGEGVRKED